MKKAKASHIIVRNHSVVLSLAYNLLCFMLDCIKGALLMYPVYLQLNSVLLLAQKIHVVHLFI